jgi:hypothetical protein
MHTGCVLYQVLYCWRYLVQQPFLSRFVRLSSILRSVCCVGLLPFHRPYVGALVIGWLGYPRFETLLLFYRSRVSRFLVFWFGALSIFNPLALWWSAVFRGNIHPSLGSWSSRCLCLLLGVWVWDNGQIFRNKFEAPIHLPSGRHFWWFNWYQSQLRIILLWSVRDPRRQHGAWFW